MWYKSPTRNQVCYTHLATSIWYSGTTTDISANQRSLVWSWTRLKSHPSAIAISCLSLRDCPSVMWLLSPLLTLDSRSPAQGIKELRNSLYQKVREGTSSPELLLQSQYALGNKVSLLGNQVHVSYTVDGYPYAHCLGLTFGTRESRNNLFPHVVRQLRAQVFITIISCLSVLLMISKKQRAVLKRINPRFQQLGTATDHLCLQRWGRQNHMWMEGLQAF